MPGSSKLGPSSIGPEFEVLELVAVGGMASVYRARQTSLDRVVALKVIDSRRVDQSAIDRFLREARLASRVQHPHVVSIFGHGVTTSGSIWISMELLEGRTLATALQHEGAFSAFRALQIARQILSGLAAAHDVGVLHRDLKPSNVFLSRPRGYRDEFAKLLDFGLARHETNPAPITAVDHVVGTLGYMSPEQSAGHPIDARSDLYSVGVLLHEMMFGRALAGHSRNRTTSATPAGMPPVPTALIDLIDHLVAFRPDERPASAHQVLDALDRVEVTPAVDRTTPGATVAVRNAAERSWRRIGTQLSALAVVGAASFVAGISFPAGLALFGRESFPAPAERAAAAEASPAPQSAEPTRPEGEVVTTGGTVPPSGIDPADAGRPLASVDRERTKRGPQFEPLAPPPPAPVRPRRTRRESGRPGQARSSDCPNGLVVESGPPNAVVTVEGQRVGRTPWRAPSSSRRPIEAKVSTPGFHPVSVKLTKDSPCVVRVRLEVRDPTIPKAGPRRGP